MHVHCPDILTLACCLLRHCDAVQAGHDMIPVTRTTNKADLCALRLKIQA